MNKNVGENKDGQILLDRYSRCNIPTGKICESLFKSQKCDLQEARNKLVFVF